MKGIGKTWLWVTGKKLGEPRGGQRTPDKKFNGRSMVGFEREEARQWLDVFDNDGPGSGRMGPDTGALRTG